MPEVGPMMRALELQRLIEDKVSEWRERSARAGAGASVADSYQQPHNFKRHTNRRKNSAEINRIIAKYSKPTKRTDERYVLPHTAPEIAPTRPARHKNKLKQSQSEDNLLSIGLMEAHPDPPDVRPPPRRLAAARYAVQKHEDMTAFVDTKHYSKSIHFEENSILNAKTVKTVPEPRLKFHSVTEDMLLTDFKDNGVGLRNKSNITTSTPLSKRKTCPSDTVSVCAFEKCTTYVASDMRKGSSEPDLLSVSTISESIGDTKTIDSKKRWSLLKPLKPLKPPFRKGTFDCLLLWRGRKPKKETTK